MRDDPKDAKFFGQIRSLLLSRRHPHHELPCRNDHHLRAIRAVRIRNGRKGTKQEYQIKNLAEPARTFSPECHGPIAYFLSG